MMLSEYVSIMITLDCIYPLIIGIIIIIYIMYEIIMYLKNKKKYLI